MFFTAKSSGTRYNSKESISAAILAPLAVLPDAQCQGVGGQLIEEGLRLLSESGVVLVFVLGHPDYYPRHGFKPAGALGFEASYPIPNEHANAWMVQELRPGVIGILSKGITCDFGIAYLPVNTCKTYFKKLKLCPC